MHDSHIAMILTVTGNPTIDRVLFVRDFAMQDVVRAEREVVSPSGKGIDVSLILHELNAPTLAISLNAGLSGEMLAALLAQRGVPYHLIPAQGETRIAALITDVAQGRQSTILAPTLTAGPQHLDALVEQVVAHAHASWGLVCAGSLPPGLPVSSWARLLQVGQAHGLVTLLDSSGAGLMHGIAGLPHILKINGRELAELAEAHGERLPAWNAPHHLHDLAAWLHDHLGRWAKAALIITLGAQGALAVTGDETIYVPAPNVPLVSAAGAGDAVAAGVMLARRQGQAWGEALRLGVAAAAAVVMNEGTAVCTAQQVYDLLPRVQIANLLQAKSIRRV
ncbi:MAG: hexose kinase [Caldilineaceae bacterium]|nr:hexose kinase [Caldilineaceae bacterium]